MPPKTVRKTVVRNAPKKIVKKVEIVPEEPEVESDLPSLYDDEEGIQMESRSSSPELEEEEIQEEEYQETKEEETQKGFKPSITKNQAGGKTHAKGALNQVKVKIIKPKKDAVKKPKQESKSNNKLWDFINVMKSKSGELVDLRRGRVEDQAINRCFYMTSAKCYVSFDLVKGETNTGLPFSIPKIFLTNTYVCKKAVAAGDENPERSIDVQFSPHEASQLVEAIKNIASKNPDIDFGFADDQE